MIDAGTARGFAFGYPGGGFPTLPSLAGMGSGIIEGALEVRGLCLRHPACSHPPGTRRGCAYPSMKTIRLVSTPTRNRRLNEIIGMIVLVSAVLLLLALTAYTPSDPSFNTVGHYITGRPAHNWTGMVAAYF